jgi:S-adenosylmethionine/arginine decarboxylase-like enzyme
MPCSAALDIFTCGASAHPEVLERGLQELLQPGLVVRQQQARGGLDMKTLSPEQRAAKVGVS